MAKVQCMLSCALLAGSAAMAQPADGVQGAVERQALQEQRRAELRQALQSERQPAQGPRPSPRQLSPQERQALREQLRQQPQRAALRPAP